METKNLYICSALKERQNAQMVKSVDTLVSGTSARKGVQVRVLFWALLGKLKPLKINIFSGFFFKFIPLFIPHRIFIYLFIYLFIYFA